MRNILLISTLLSFTLLLAHAVNADVLLYTGALDVLASSGKACVGGKKHSISLVIGSDESHESHFGYVGGDTIMVGQLRGHSLSSLTVRYPFPDGERAEGHTMRVEVNGTTMKGELHVRNIDPTDDGCKFDLARLTLLQSDGAEAAQSVYLLLSKSYEAQLVRSTALSIARSGAHNESVHVYEQALALADDLYKPNSAQLIPYLTGLANSYVRTGRFQDFNTLYESRIDTLNNDAVRLIFTHHQTLSLLQVGRAALGRDDYQTALYNSRQALKIDYKNKDAIALTMSALVRSGRHDEAIVFLEQTEKKLDSETERQGVREAIAQLAYQKGLKDQSAGRHSEAERSLRKAVKLDPGTSDYLISLARLVHKTGKYAEADAILKRGLIFCKDDARRQELTEALEKLRQTEIILTKLRRAGS